MEACELAVDLFSGSPECKWVCTALTTPYAACRCQVAEFKRNSEKWRSHVKSAEALQQDFADLIDDAPKSEAIAEPTVAQEGKEANGKIERKARKRKKVSADSPDEAAPVVISEAITGTEESKPERSKKEKSKAVRKKDTDQAQNGKASKEAAEEVAPERSKQEAELSEPVPGAEGEADAAPKAKKRKKGKKVDEEVAADSLLPDTIAEAKGADDAAIEKANGTSPACKTCVQMLSTFHASIIRR